VEIGLRQGGEMFQFSGANLEKALLVQKLLSLKPQVDFKKNTTEFQA